jgi:hypothetical protein
MFGNRENEEKKIIKEEEKKKNLNLFESLSSLSIKNTKETQNP